MAGASYRTTSKPVLFKILNEFLVSRRGECSMRSLAVYERAVVQLYEIFGRDARLDRMTAREILDAIMAACKEQSRHRMNLLVDVLNMAQKLAVEQGRATVVVPVPRLEKAHWIERDPDDGATPMPHFTPRQHWPR